MLQTGAQLYTVRSYTQTIEDFTCTIQKIADIGYKTVQLPAIFRALEASNCKYMLVEQDDCYGESPFDCLKTSYENLSKAGYR